MHLAFSSNSPSSGLLRPVQTRSLYSDRVCPAAETVARLLPHLRKLGITRLADQTGLDNIGIPCFAAIRPNSRTLATNQGKGIDADAAKASALMEAFEYAIAEQPTIMPRLASIAELEAAGTAFHWPERLLPQDATIDTARVLRWLPGYNLFSGSPILVPYEVAAIGHDGADLPGVSVSTNGLASGNTRQEAVFHALCELIERDACSLMSLQPDDALRRVQVRPEALGDVVVDDLLERIRRAGCNVTLFNVTSNLGVPAFEAVIFDDVTESDRHFDLSAGAGCHPVTARAALRAITEAAQTRLTNIAGARDDFSPAEYRFALDPTLVVYRSAGAAAGGVLPEGCPIGASLDELQAWLDAALYRRKVGEVIVVPLGGEEFGGSVVKVLAPRLEDRAPNRNWRPGPRALSAMLRFA